VSEWDELETRLRQELGRVAAPEGFADRVMARASAQRRGRVAPRLAELRPLVQQRIWLAVAAAVLVAVSAGFAVRLEDRIAQQRQERAKAARAEHQFELAMQVTGRTLENVQERIRRAGAKQEQ
jgi:hypothetical protein